MEKELQTNPFTIPATVAECQELAFKLGEERAKIDLALSQSMVNEKQRGIPPNWDWIGRARYAHKLKGIQIARLNGKISELRQAEKKSMAEAFLMATQEIFDQADLQDVWDLVHQRHPEFRREVALG